MKTFFLFARVGGPLLVIYLNQAPLHHLCVDLRMDTKKMRSREIGLHAPVLSTVLSSILKHHWGDLSDHLQRNRTFTLIMTNILMSTKNCGERGCDLDLDLLIILCSLHVYLSKEWWMQRQSFQCSAHFRQFLLSCRLSSKSGVGILN